MGAMKIGGRAIRPWTSAGARRVLGVVVVAVCGSVAVASAQSTHDASANVALQHPLRVVDPSYMDTTVKACQNFFRFANGHWLDTDTIPAAYGSSSVGKDMTDRNEAVVRSVLDDAMTRRVSEPASSTQRKLGTFYATCMDSTRAESDGITPLAPTLDTIAAIRSRAALLRQIALLHHQGVDVLFFYSAQPDLHDTYHYMAGVQQGGLGMPDRDYYTDTGHVADSLRQQYVSHVERTLALSGVSPGEASRGARQVMALEAALAGASLTRTAQRDPSALDHAMSLDSLHSLVPQLDWASYFRRAGLKKLPARVNVAEPAFFRRAGALLDSIPLADWRAYLRYHVVAASAPWLSTPFVKGSFAYTSLFSGATELLPRWKRCLQAADANIGEALGQAYVAKTFSPGAKARARRVIDDVREAFRQRLLKLTWMSDSTRREALVKLASMHEKIGYPDTWRDYSRLEVTDQPFVLNLFGANRFEWERTVNRPGMAVDTTEWGITVPTVDAYNDPTKNEMVFPAGALEPQTFDSAADDGANYGSLAGSWAGHELTHGFDDEGRHFDAHGNLRDWWTTADSAAFARQAGLMVQQFDGYVQVDSLHVNGMLTLGEDIADFGGVLTGYDALEQALGRNGRPGLIDGFTPEQRFFIAYAQSWRGHDRPALLRARETVDPHAPGMWRVIGPLSDDPEFAHAFGCKPGDPMVRPADVVPHIW
jgi:putative endopeptidase